VQAARALLVHVVWHPHNAGYGANQKTCYIEALQRGADAIVTLHPDGQYPPELIPAMVEPVLTGGADLVLGSRLAVAGMARANGMPMWKYVANRFLTMTENRIMGTHLTEAHTGCRAYSRHMLLTIPFLRNSPDFVFDTEVILQPLTSGCELRRCPRPAGTSMTCRRSASRTPWSMAEDASGVLPPGAAPRRDLEVGEVFAPRTGRRVPTPRQ
jgi:glycosyltransferase involved in cell wall biosynthesis